MHALRLLWAARNEDMLLRRQRRNVFRQSLNKIEELPDVLFKERFWLNKQDFMELCFDLREHASLRGTREIPLELKVLCALSFLATGSHQRIVGLTQHLPQRTASRCIKEVVEALNNDIIIKKWIQFPQTQGERSKIRQEFKSRYNLPGVIGCIGCTHIAIVKPNEDDHLFYNTKGYHTLNVQMICDHNLKILDVDANHGGATPDSCIWSSSKAESNLRELHQNGEQTWLLGHSEYPQTPWLMTPIPNAAPNTQEELYTKRHIQARNCIERCIDLLKSRWKCLRRNHSLRYHPLFASKIILACCVLHNIAVSSGLPAPSDTVEQNDQVDDS